MKKSKKQKCAFDLLPFHVIEAASTGDTEAIQAVLKHYEGYITVLATRKMVYKPRRRVISSIYSCMT